jgi:hypothetical protein
MTRRWEYLSFSLQKKVEKKTKPALSEPFLEEVEEEYWFYTNTIYIWRPGVEKAEERLAWMTGDSDSRTDPLQVLNELGAEGWELVDRVVLGSAVGKSQGWNTAGWPIETVWTMKREVD